MSQSAPRQDSSSSDSDSQPNNLPVFRPNNRISLCARLKSNWPYFKTRLGILKIFSVVTVTHLNRGCHGTLIMCYTNNNNT